MCKKELYVVGAAITMAVITVMFVPMTGIAGSLEPSAVPAPTMKTLDQVPPTWSIKIPGADRFVVLADFNNEAVLDKETGLVWEKSPKLQTIYPFTFQLAKEACQNAVVGNRMGLRLPTAEELASLMDPSETNPSLPSGHPFILSQFGFWTATTHDTIPTVAKSVVFWMGVGVTNVTKDGNAALWCVRGGHGYDAY